MFQRAQERTADENFCLPITNALNPFVIISPKSFRLGIAVYFHTFSPNWDFLEKQVQILIPHVLFTNDVHIVQLVVAEQHSAMLRACIIKYEKRVKRKHFCDLWLRRHERILSRVWAICVVNRSERDLLAAALLMLSVTLNLAFVTFLSLIKT